MISIRNRKVIVYFPSFPPNKIGGSEIQAIRLSNELKKNKLDIIFLTPWRIGMKKTFQYDGFKVFTFYTVLEITKSILKFKPKNSEKVENNKIKFDYIGENKLYSNTNVTLFDFIIFFDFLISLLVHFLHNHRKVKLIHVNTITSIAPIFAILTIFFKKKLLVKDSTMDGIVQLHSAPFKNILRKTLVKKGYFVAMTNIIYNNYLNAGIDKVKITQIPNGVDIQENTEVNFNTDPNLCLFVGNLYQQPAKGIDVLIKSWTIVLKSNPKAKLVIIGSGDLNQYVAYCDKLKLNNSIIFKGGISPIDDYNKCSLFILPSRREGMANSLLEAMSFGLAVVATNISGNVDLIENNVNGILVQSNDINALAEAITNVFSIANYKYHFGLKNRNKIISGYTIEKIASEYKKVYDLLVI
jgi:glycosyltransferase involved in cell wall biosynthesis